MRLGIDIGATKVNIGLVDDTGLILASKKLTVPKEHGGAQGYGCRGVLQAVADGVSVLLADTGSRQSDITACGMGVPGTVSPDGLTAVKIPNLGWESEPCASIFQDLTGLRARLIQDSRAAALGEYLAGAGRGRRLLVCLTLGTGIGTGIVMDGNILHGALGSAGEVGHIQSVPNGRACGCGRMGCMEAYAAGKGIAQSASEHPSFAHRDSSSEAVFAAAHSGDGVALAIVADAVEKLGRAVVAVVNVLSPDALIFSGGMCAQEKLFVAPVMSYLREHAYALSVDSRLLLCTAALGDAAPMVGAALLDRASTL